MRKKSRAEPFHFEMHNRLIGRVVVVIVAEEVNGSIAGIKYVELNRCIMVCNKGERESLLRNLLSVR